MIHKVNHRDPAIAIQLHALQIAAYTIEAELIGYPDLPPLRQSVEDVQRLDYEFWVYPKDARIVGTAALERDPNSVNIASLIVHPDFFRQGIATQLLKAVEELKPSVPEITVSTAAVNHPAVTLYQKNGFRIRKRTITSDGLILVQLQKTIVQLRPDPANFPTFCHVIQDYQAAYPDPLIIMAGERLTVGERDNEWEGWIWCVNMKGKGGWVPESYLVEISGPFATTQIDYTAKELTVQQGQTLIISQAESGWYWCTNQAGESGWVPAKHVEITGQKPATGGV